MMTTFVSVFSPKQVKSTKHQGWIMGCLKNALGTVHCRMYIPVSGRSSFLSSKYLVVVLFYIWSLININVSTLV